MQRGPYRAVILYTVKIVVRCFTQFTIRRAVDHRCWSRTEGRCENWAEHHFGEAHALQLLKKASYHPPRQGLPILFKRLIPHSSITLCQDPNKFFFLPDSPALSTCAAGTRREDRTTPAPMLTSRHCLFTHRAAQGLCVLPTDVLPNKQRTLLGSPSSSSWHGCLGTSGWLQLGLMKKHIPHPFSTPQVYLCKRQQHTLL